MKSDLKPVLLTLLMTSLFHKMIICQIDAFTSDVCSSDSVSEIFSMKEETPRESGSGRSKRNLIFPTGSIFQISLGVTTPTEIKLNKLQFSYGYQQNIKLPTNITELRDPPQATAARNLDVYDHLEELLQGSECLQKSICQIAATGLSPGLIEDLIALVFTPSKHVKADKETSSSQSRANVYLRSEKWGKSGKNCSLKFPRCAKTVFDSVLMDKAIN